MDYIHSLNLINKYTNVVTEKVHSYLARVSYEVSLLYYLKRKKIIIYTQLANTPHRDTVYYVFYVLVSVKSLPCQRIGSI